MIYSYEFLTFWCNQFRMFLFFVTKNITLDNLNVWQIILMLLLYIIILQNLQYYYKSKYPYKTTMIAYFNLIYDISFI